MTADENHEFIIRVLTVLIVQCGGTVKIKESDLEALRGRITICKFETEDTLTCFYTEPTGGVK